MSGTQFLRKCTLLITDRNGDALDLSNLKIKFTVKRSDTQTPNTAEIFIYNMEQQTMERIKKEFSRVILQAGYEENFGVIFEGNIKQAFDGRENQTDTFLFIIAGDGDLSYNYAVVNTTLAAGSGQAEQVNAAVKSMTETGGTTAGNIGDLPSEKLPRGKTLFGMARDFLKQSAETSNKTWSIQNGKVQMVPVTSYLPGEAVVLTSKTGLVEKPLQTSEGVTAKCLLNPKIKIGGRIQLDNKDVQRLKIDMSNPTSPANTPAPLTADGVYYVLVIEYVGDTRGNEWYSMLTCLNLDVTTNPINAVQVGY